MSSFLRGRVTVLVALSGRPVVLTVRQLHAALLLNLQHLQHQHARPVHWRAEQQQHRCWVCASVAVCVYESVLSVGLIMRYESNSLLASEQFALHSCKAVTDSGWVGYETQRIPLGECANVWNVTTTLTVLLLARAINSTELIKRSKSRQCPEAVNWTEITWLRANFVCKVDCIELWKLQHERSRFGVCVR